jgi:hypothetical protein
MNRSSDTNYNYPDEFTENSSDFEYSRRIQRIYDLVDTINQSQNAPSHITYEFTFNTPAANITNIFDTPSTSISSIFNTFGALPRHNPQVINSPFLNFNGNAGLRSNNEIFDIMSIFSNQLNNPTTFFQQLIQQEDVQVSANPTDIQSLKVVKYHELKKNEKYIKSSMGNTCNICLDDYQDEDEVRILKCEHLYHTKCIDRWLTSSNKCPVCKSDISSNPLYH